MASDIPNVFELISSEYYALTASEKKTADFVLASQADTQFMSISELADACGVAEATISRFCRRLGFKGYNAFKLAVANSTVQPKNWNNPLSGEVRSEDSMEEVCRKLLATNQDAMTQTLEMIRPEAIRQAADLLEQSDKVLCMGQGGSMLIASEAAHLFSTVSNKFFPVSDSHMQAVAATMMGKNDTILFFSYSGSTLAMMETLKLAARRGGKVILVTRFLNSPGAELADVVLQCGANESPLQLGSVAAKIAQLYLMDVLFSEFCRRDLDEYRACRSRIADALAEKHV